MKKRALERDPASRQRVEALFEKALERPPEERAPLLEEACPDAPEIRAEVASLLDAHDQAGPFLETADPELAAALLEAAGEPLAEGQQVGPYRVIRELGRGGMGAVYLAARADGQFEQQVALKLIKLGMDSEAIQQRFLTERQILARLRHDNVARLLDGGVTHDGRPYFAMEYVEGVPITRYCDDHRLSVSQRLALFDDVCRAVQYAHGSLVVHRDLKPSNILVTAAGEVRLLDFGIAKLLDESGEAGATLHTGLRPMTPEYAAPEQVRGDPATTATDVYALGVILYELLAGQRPYLLERRAPDAVARLICEVEPVLPSAAVRRVEEIRLPDGTTDRITPEAVSRARSTQASQLRRQLSGDLDTVVLKALRKEPERRYVSAEALREEIERYLTGLPVSARRDTLAYRASKFVRRHTLGVAAATLLLLTLALGLAGTAWQARTAAQEAAKAEVVKNFVLGLFAVSDPNTARGETVTARELLDQGALRIESELADQPQVQAEMLTVVGEIYQKLGLYDEAQPLLEQALTLRRQRLGEIHPEVAASLNSLAALVYARGSYDEAEQLYRRALTLDRRLHRGEHPDVARSLNNLSVVVRARGQYDEAHSLAREALVMRRRLLGRAHPDVVESLVNVAVPLYLKGDLGAAEPLYREALEMRRRLLGEEHLDVAATMNRLGLLLRRRRGYDEAERLFRRTLEIYRKLLGEEHPDVAIVLGNLAQVFNDRRDLDAAASLYRESLTIHRKVLGTDHPDLATTLNNLATVYLETRDYDRAESVFREALAIWRKVHGEEHPYVAIGINNLANAILRDGEGDYAAAEPLFREALAMRRKLLGEHRDVAESLFSLASLLRWKGDYEGAVDLAREALELRRKLRGNEHLRVALSLSQLGLTLSSQGDDDAAEPLLREALAQRQKLLGGEHPDVASSLNNLGVVLLNQGDYDAAEPLLREAIDMFRRTLPGDHPNLAVPLLGLGRLHLARDRPGEAEAALREALEIRERALPAGSWRRAEAQSVLGASLSALGRFEEAERLLHDGHDGLKAARGEQDPTTRRAARYLAAYYERQR